MEKPQRHISERIKKLSAYRSGDQGIDEEFTSNWKHFNLMSFLKNDIMPVEDSNLNDNEDEDLDVSIRSEAQSSPLASPRTENVSPVPSKSPSPPRNVSPARSVQTEAAPPSKKRPKPNNIRAEYLEIERKKLKILQYEMAKNIYQNTPNVEKTDDYYFLMSILPEMQKLKPIQKMRLRNKINEALMEEMSMAKYV